MAKVKFEIEGMDELVRNVKKIGGVPKKHVTASVQKGMKPELKKAVAGAPHKTGALRKSMKLVGESTKIPAKKAYRVVYDRAYNAEFQKKNKAGKVGGYYPISMQYGFFDKSGKFQSGSSKTGWKSGFGIDTFDGPGFERTVIGELTKKLEKEIAKAGM